MCVQCKALFTLISNVAIVDIWLGWWLFNTVKKRQSQNEEIASMGHSSVGQLFCSLPRLVWVLRGADINGSRHKYKSFITNCPPWPHQSVASSAGDLLHNH